MSMSFDPPDTKKELQTFSPTEEAIAELSVKYLALRVDGPTDKEGYAVIHKARMATKTMRIEIEKRRKELKADSITYGRAVDARAKHLTALVEPIETHLLAEEKIVDDEKERIKNERRLREEAFIKAKEDAEKAEAKRIADEEAARIKAEQDAENERLRVEREKLEAEQDALRKAEEAQEKKRVEDQQAAIRAQLAEEKKQRLAQEKLDADRLAHNQKMKAEQQAIADETNRLAKIEAKRVQVAELEKAKVEAAEKAKRDTEARIAREKEEAEAKAKAEEDARVREKALQPDKLKLMHVAVAVRAIVVPNVSPVAAKASSEIGRELIACSIRIADIAEGLK